MIRRMFYSTGGRESPTGRAARNTSHVRANRRSIRASCRDPYVLFHCVARILSDGAKNPTEFGYRVSADSNKQWGSIDQVPEVVQPVERSVVATGQEEYRHNGDRAF